MKMAAETEKQTKMSKAIDKLLEMQQDRAEDDPSRWYGGGYYCGYIENHHYPHSFSNVKCEEAWLLGREDGVGDRLAENG
jgi:hypothetical protein